MMWPHRWGIASWAYGTAWISRSKSLLWAALPLAVLVATASAAQAAIDLRIASILYTAPLPGPVAGEAVPIVVTVVNDGTETSPAFRVALWKDRAAAPTSLAGSDQDVTVASLAPGIDNARIVKFDVPYDTPGTYFLWVLVDPTGVVTQVTRDNDVYSILLPVSQAAPDLIVDNLEPGADRPVANQPFTMAVTIKNQGQLDAGPFSVAVFHDRQIAPRSAEGNDGTQQVSGLAAGESASLNFEVTYGATGDYTFQAMADGDAAVAESDEDNNTGGIVLTVTSGGGGGCGGRGAGPADFLPLLAVALSLGMTCLRRFTRVS